MHRMRGRLYTLRVNRGLLQSFLKVVSHHVASLLDRS